MYWLHFTRFYALACRIHTHSVKTNLISLVFCPSKFLRSISRTSLHFCIPKIRESLAWRPISKNLPTAFLTSSLVSRKFPLSSFPLSLPFFQQRLHLKAVKEGEGVNAKKFLRHLGRTFSLDSLRDETFPRAYFGTEIRIPKSLARRIFISGRLGYEHFTGYRIFKFADKPVSLYYNPNGCFYRPLALQTQAEVT